MLEKIINELICLKDRLKSDGYTYTDYDCINDACNVLEQLNHSYPDMSEELVDKIISVNREASSRRK